MESMSGGLKVVSEPGKGSTFTATLPSRYVVRAGTT
jgi:signal transduction histidine kinase